ncbi:MAG: 50S ribosomal protein L9 [Clostridiales bacterium]|uniref:Large ribosomal subunit protein bL9 n=1 Tax=Candidatus Anaerobutyricum stercoripullorum TaxID=2838456 RepID=A0A9D2BFE0_9FIRM|nr:50S ribosomal protein L9 [Clostridiales bacterium]HIX73244.1 50S ribosomal protein L9 [Candidatus Anaerobutyricum stercoripullorum]
MKVILLEDVKALGKKGDMVEVNNGYARNFILPKKLGVEATGKNVNDLKLQKAHQDKVAAEQLAAAKELSAQIAELSVEVKMKVGEGGKTFGAISTKEIAAAAKEQLNLELDKKKISVDEPIRSLGVHNVKIKLHPKVTATLKVKVSEM